MRARGIDGACGSGGADQAKPCDSPALKERGLKVTGLVARARRRFSRTNARPSTEGPRHAYSGCWGTAGRTGAGWMRAADDIGPGMSMSRGRFPRPRNDRSCPGETIGLVVLVRPISPAASRLLLLERDPCNGGHACGGGARDGGRLGPDRDARRSSKQKHQRQECCNQAETSAPEHEQLAEPSGRPRRS